MDYVVGSVAALITGNVTPNRPKLVRRALTPTKHQPSPNVTPKSEFVDDRSIFLSPTLQKKKAIVKKSPKRIFENPELDATESEETNSPKADKVKKHLKDDLESDEMGKINKKSPNKKQNKSLDTSSSLETSKIDNSQVNIEGSPKKKKKRNSESNVSIESKVEILNTTDNAPEEVQNPVKTPKKKKQKKSETNYEEEIPKLSEPDDNNTISEQIKENNQTIRNKKNKKHNKNQSDPNITNKENESTLTATLTQTDIKKKKKKNKKLQNQEKIESMDTETSTKSKKNKTTEKQSNSTEIEVDNDEENSENEQLSTTANPNAITEQDSDSEHDSDDEIDSENEQTNKQLLETEQADESTDEEDNNIKVNKEKKGQKDKKQIPDTKEKEVNIEEEIKRTIFVGNVPLSKKTRKEIKKIFRPYGEIETIRIRFVPVKDARVTPKVAVITNELHPERSTVNVYVKFADPASVEKALVENNTVLNGNHLRVTRSGSTGSEHDPHLAIFVGNLPFGIEDEQLRAQFDKCGQIESVRIIRDKKTNAGKGFGYVNFTSKDGVELALNLSEEDLTIKNRILRVKRCTQTLGQMKKPGNQSGQMNRGGENRPGQMNRQGGMNRGGGNRSGPMNGPGGMSRGGGNRPGQMNRPGGMSRGGMSRGGMSRGGMSRDGMSRGGMSRGGENRSGAMNRGGEKRPGEMNNREDGAHRRIMNKRQFQENSDGPPNKRPRNINQPGKEKKQRKEFVGMTSEKRKKPKFNKGQKKKKILSEILTKKKS